MPDPWKRRQTRKLMCVVCGRRRRVEQMLVTSAGAYCRAHTAPYSGVVVSGEREG